MFCFHRYVLTDFKPTGYAALDWTLTPTREWERTQQCEKCGKVKKTRGLCIPRCFDRKLNPDSYNDRGWPVDKDGVEMNPPK